MKRPIKIRVEIDIDEKYPEFCGKSCRWLPDENAKRCILFNQCLPTPEKPDGNLFYHRLSKCIKAWGETKKEEHREDKNK